MTLKKPEPLNKNHHLVSFDSNYHELDTWLKKHAFQAQTSGSAKTFIVTHDDQVVGYYSLTIGQVDINEVTDRIKKGMGHYPIPVVILARLAVHISFQKKGIGRGMLKDALLRTLLIAEQSGVRALLVHAIDDNAKTFYQRFGFEVSPIRENQLLLLLKDARQMLAKVNFG